ncbi:YifB family Mg chelatase-like AAA ATPase [Parvularcula sp. ZS-1/3]|uniref:YifB family Mg chelatase-like AAA ATPase n=1 Tax=Parvularcula mediterranea TaxID=2732508 RepID=A0A7Y3W5C2_9PROT|nr:YifB family Mg chelatase-like AAA ATPase [Parvularcula mediterranea]NNU16116.1 YifB family Mg chelatase-like AAA ATPase [Parvularcula mediterranea]
MVAEVTSFAFEGVEAREVTVQAHMTGGNPAVVIVGLPDKSVSEAKDRISAAFSAIGLGLPPKRITVNLAPADLRKEGSHFDLPIALALMAEMGAIPRDAVEGMAVIGELGLDGTIAKTTGALPAAVAANSLDLGLICSEASGAEAAWAGGDAKIIAAKSLVQLANHFKGTQVLAQPKPGPLLPTESVPDLADVKGQETARRALEVAAAGGHNLVLIGPPGSGKSMLASRLPGLLPPLSPEEMLEVSMIQSVAGLISDGALSRSRPFRAPHHSASMAAMVGGGMRAKPGEASLAHRGVLFLDELPEFSAPVLDSLRQPLETGDILIARANAHVRYPARFQLVAAMNPCRCGAMCIRGPSCAPKYQSRVSGPFLDRMDITIETPPVSALDLASPAEGEDTATVAARVLAAREAQKERGPINAQLGESALTQAAQPDDAGLGLLRRACEQLNLSARGYTRILRVARTLADLDGSDALRRVHIAEAISFRRPEPAAIKAPG